MMIPELRSEFADLPHVLAENDEIIRESYQKVFETLLDSESYGEEHFQECCTLLAVYLLGEKHELTLPVDYHTEDEELIITLAQELYSYLNLSNVLDSLVEQGLIEKVIIDGEVHYSTVKNKDSKPS